MLGMEQKTLRRPLHSGAPFWLGFGYAVFHRLFLVIKANFDTVDLSKEFQIYQQQTFLAMLYS